MFQLLQEQVVTVDVSLVLNGEPYSGLWPVMNIRSVRVITLNLQLFILATCAVFHL